MKTKKDVTDARGYAIGFAPMLPYVHDQLPTNEIITQALRETAEIYPEIALRELIANAVFTRIFQLLVLARLLKYLMTVLKFLTPVSH
mgnify:CR=1 FL=1